MASKDIGEMTIPELKGELRRRNAKLNGRKADLVERYVWAIICVFVISLSDCVKCTMNCLIRVGIFAI
jgi:hypothetical protein